MIILTCLKKFISPSLTSFEKKLFRVYRRQIAINDYVVILDLLFTLVNFSFIISLFFRYQSLRRTIRGHRRHHEIDSPSNTPQGTPQVTPKGIPQVSTSQNTQPTSGPTTTVSPSSTLPQTTSQSQSLTDGGQERQRQPVIERTDSGGERTSFANTPGCKFLRRRDFFQFINNHTVSSFEKHKIIIRTCLTEIQQCDGLVTVVWNLIDHTVIENVLKTIDNDLYRGLLSFRQIALVYTSCPGHAKPKKNQSRSILALQRLDV